MTTLAIPELYFDGTMIDVLWDNHDEAIRWYQKFMSWEIGQMESWKPDPRCKQGRMTRMNWGTWLISGLADVRLPHHYAERGTVESNVRLCWRTRDLAQLHRHYKASGIRVTDLYRGAGDTTYFDFWATCEGIRFTAQEDTRIREDGLVPSWIRVGVSDLARSIQWYRDYLGMELEKERIEDGYVIMSLRLHHQPHARSLWVLEQLAHDAYIGKVDGTVQPVCWIGDRAEFFRYHTLLFGSGIETSGIGGYLTKGLVGFHIYDPDGNRLNFSSM